jgi:hypothetical protein
VFEHFAKTIKLYSWHRMKILAVRLYRHFAGYCVKRAIRFALQTCQRGMRRAAAQWKRVSKMPKRPMCKICVNETLK